MKMENQSQGYMNMQKGFLLDVFHTCNDKRALTASYNRSTSIVSPTISGGICESKSIACKESCMDSGLSVGHRYASYTGMVNFFSWRINPCIHVRVCITYRCRTRVFQVRPTKIEANKYDNWILTSVTSFFYFQTLMQEIIYLQSFSCTI